MLIKARKEFSKSKFASAVKEEEKEEENKKALTEEEEEKMLEAEFKKMDLDKEKGT